MKFIAEWVIFNEIMKVHPISMAISDKGKEDQFNGTQSKQRVEANTGCYWIYLKWSFAWWLWCLESDVAKQITGDEL